MASSGAGSPAATAVRQEFFKQIKPCCVSILRLAGPGAPATPQRFRELSQLLEELFERVSEQIQRDASAMNENMAAYIFMPLTRVFSIPGQLPGRIVELALKNLAVVLHHGWRTKLPTDHVSPILSLLVFIVDGNQEKKDAPAVPEETALEVYRCMTALITAAGTSPGGSDALVEMATMLVLGQAITAMLKGATAGSSPDVQVEALRAVQAVFTSIKDHGALAGFLPATVSALAAILSIPANQKRRVLVYALQTLQQVLIRVLGDLRTRGITKPELVEPKGEGKVLTPAWLTATASQVKLALPSALKLRTHEAENVRAALERLCVTLLDECHVSLANCSQILVETALILTPETKEDSLMVTSLEDLVRIYPELGESVKVAVYNWITSLPRVMQSSDESAKQRAIQILQKGISTVADLGIDSSTLEDAIASSFRDSVSAFSASSKASRVTDESSLWNTGELVKSGPSFPTYRPVLMSQESQLATRESLLQLLSSIGPSSSQTKLAMEMINFTREATGDKQVSAYWLSFELTKAALTRTSEIDALMDFTSSGPGEEEDGFQDLYDFSVSILDAHSELSDMDWRMEALAMEVTAFAAQRAGEQFRPELIDLLFPIATFLGSQNPQLRDHAIITLNCLASACEYDSVSELIVENADYMVNSVSLRLNTFDISPSLTKVLTMMIRLTGPKLIPFLDDAVASVFAALENYHGYPVFVEGLFSVLKEIVEQGVKSDRLLLGGANSLVVTDHKKRRAKEVTFQDVLGDLKEWKKRRVETDSENYEKKGEGGYPERPWKAERGDSAVEDEVGEQVADGEENKPVATPTYTLLRKVAELTQHYLTSPTPTLRKSLLELLAIVSPSLAADEDVYLPLINALWPVVVNRLYDSEPFVVIAACEALCGICAAAGDFLTSRIKAEWWSGLGKWARKTQQAAVGYAGQKLPAVRSARGGGQGSSQGNTILIPVRSGGALEGKVPADLSLSTKVASTSSSLGRFAQAAQVWDAVVQLLIAIVSYVRVEDAIFDEILAMLADTLLENDEAREALEAVNADAVWLVMYERGEVEWRPTPVLAGVIFAPMQERVLDADSL